MDTDQHSAAVGYCTGKGSATSAIRVLLESLHRSCTKVQQMGKVR